MNINRKIAIIVGVLFLVAMFTSIPGGFLVEAALTTPDYLNEVSTNTTQMSLGIFLEYINCIAIVGIAVMLFPIFRQCSEAIALGYVGFRIIEAVFLLIAATIPLSVITLSQEYVKAGAADAAYFQTLGTALISVRSHAYALPSPVFFSLGALLFYFVLYQTRLLPRFIAVWGFIGVALILVLNLIEIDFSIGMFLALPIITNEIFLGIWLIVKGFNPSAIAPMTTKTDMNRLTPSYAEN